MKEVRSNFVKESLLDYESLANSLKENTSQAVRDLLGEAVRDTYNQILNEEKDEDEYEVEEVDDTVSDTTDDAEEQEKEFDETEEETEDVEDDVEIEDNDESDEEPSEEDAWAEFEKYKVSDDEYDFSEAKDDEIVKVYKLLKDEDQVHVNVDKEKNKVELKDDETGAEYLIDLNSFSNSDFEENDVDFGDETDNIKENKNMNESRFFEIILNEYDSHVGYTDNYQKKDVMTNDGSKEPAKNANSWDAGVPKTEKKPWSGLNKKAEPFNEEEMIEEEPMEEGTNVGGFVQQNSTTKSHVPNSNGRDARNASKGGVKTKGTTEPRYDGTTNESKMMEKVEKILKENKQLKSTLNQFKKVLEEAAVTNVNLGQIIKLISENSTTKDEKQEIIARFGKEAKTVEQSKQLYETISRELSKNNTMNINEEKQFTTNNSKMINETQIYKSQDVMESLDLMHRLCK